MQNSTSSTKNKPGSGTGQLPAVERVEPGSDQHWLTQPATIRRLWWILGIVLFAMLLAQTFIPVKGKGTLDSIFGFGAWYGFGVCVLMVLAAKILGWLLKRPESYYTPDESPSSDKGGDDA